MEKEKLLEEYLSFGEFYKLEKEFDLFSLQYKGVNYWQLIRFDVHTKLCFSLYNVSGGESTQKNGMEIAGIFWQAFKMIWRWKKLPVVDFVRVRPEVQIDPEGCFCDRQYDYLDLGDDIKAADLFALGTYCSVPKVATFTMATAEARFILGRIKRKVFGKEKFDSQQENVLCCFFSKLAELYNISFSVEEMIPEIQYLVDNYLCYYNSYLHLFRKMRPRAIMLSTYYDLHMFSAVAAARELGIKSIEVQHGEIVDHVAYWYEDQSANGKILPDYFLAYGQWWIDHARLPECMEAVVVGNPYLDDQVKKYPENSCSKTITFFSNIISGNDIIELIASCYDEILDMGYKVVFKLHPGEFGNWKNAYPFLLEHPEIKVVESGSIYELISESTVIMGLRSTVFYEALAYENVVIALDPKGNMRALLDAGLAVAVTEKTDLINILKSGIGVNKQRDNIAADMFLPNGANNTVEYIERLIF